jgi:GNAT superfamily N-acetyltransferase
MGRKVVSLTMDNIADLPGPCRDCTLWELGNRASSPATKDEWVSAVLLDWGSCGRILYVDNQVAGFAMYAPAHYVEGAHAIVGASVSADAVMLMTARILPAFQGGGLGRVLIQSIAKDVMGRRKVRGIEAFGDAQNHENGCLVPASFLTAVGFKTVQPHPRYPRLRLDLRGVLSWRDPTRHAAGCHPGAGRRDARRTSTLGLLIGASCEDVTNPTTLSIAGPDPTGGASCSMPRMHASWPTSTRTYSAGRSRQTATTSAR